MKKLFNIKVNKLAFKAPPESKQAVMMMNMEMRGGKVEATRY